MEITTNIGNYKNDIVRMAYENYIKELGTFKNYEVKSKEYIENYILERLPDMEGLVYNDGVVTGYLLCYTYKDNNTTYCTVPVWGYGAQTNNKEKIMTRLFQELAKKKADKEKLHFEVNIYAHDFEMQRLFSFMQFGIQCEIGIRYITKLGNDIASDIRELPKEELESRWTEVWSLLERLIKHLQESPVFYPGTEFTEGVYKNFFHDAATRVFVAEQDKKIVGLIEANLEENTFILGEEHSCNVGEAYVIEELRGSGLAKWLLDYVDHAMYEDGYRYEWVEHGTANPNARGFWNKYFDSYSYTMIRDIDL